ncbi:hypothetical protein V5E97_24855 [Singulisphaera sp. Ch08]|uniref:Transmembrane protein n=1 Tax=Singulisphaera sp. Ch08 TaxID=3120278 RepID=A0AAU7C851_9BACT
METKKALPGPGHFQWHTGAWFGVQLCLTGWMLVGAVAFVRRAPEVAGIWLVCLAVANAIGSWIWWRRDRVRPYPALQALLLTCLVIGMPALVALYTLRPGLDVTFIRPTGIYLWDQHWIRFLVLIVIMTTSSYFMERSARKEKSRAEGRPSS